MDELLPFDAWKHIMSYFQKEDFYNFILLCKFSEETSELFFEDFFDQQKLKLPTFSLFKRRVYYYKIILKKDLTNGDIHETLWKERVIDEENKNKLLEVEDSLTSLNESLRIILNNLNDSNLLEIFLFTYKTIFSDFVLFNKLYDIYELDNEEIKLDNSLVYKKEKFMNDLVKKVKKIIFFFFTKFVRVLKRRFLTKEI